MNPTETKPGMLTLVSTPIGNLGDITMRAIETLRSADVILCEDTRHSGKLLSHIDVKNTLFSYHDHNKERVTPGLIERLLAGKNIALITDAGTPGVSDPGFYIVRAAVEANIVVTTAPGPSAIIPALVVSGLPTDRFSFEGFTPKKRAELTRVMQGLGEETRTTIYYVAPHQLIKVLEVCGEQLPERRLVVARELTKLHEEVRRGTAAELLAYYGDRKIRGEIVMLIGGQEKRSKRRKADTLDDKPPVL